MDTGPGRLNRPCPKGRLAQSPEASLAISPFTVATGMIPRGELGVEGQPRFPTGFSALGREEKQTTV